MSMRKREEKKKKKEKIIYVDDGSTIVDMSALGGASEGEKPYRDDTQKPLPRWRQILRTYFESMRLMILPMLVFMGLIAVAFFILWLIFQFGA